MTDQERIEKAKELIGHAESIIADMDATDDFYVSTIQDDIANLLGDLDFMQFDDSGNVISDDDEDIEEIDYDDEDDEDDDYEDDDSEDDEDEEEED